MKDYGTLKSELKELRYSLITAKDDNEAKKIKTQIEQVKKKS